MVTWIEIIGGIAGLATTIWVAHYFWNQTSHPEEDDLEQAYQIGRENGREEVVEEIEEYVEEDYEDEDDEE